jgi:hypothetical protein
LARGFRVGEKREEEEEKPRKSFTEFRVGDVAVVFCKLLTRPLEIVPLS